jgi:hypothetical protein
MGSLRHSKKVPTGNRIPRAKSNRLLLDSREAQRYPEGIGINMDIAAFLE